MGRRADLQARFVQGLLRGLDRLSARMAAGYAPHSSNAVRAQNMGDKFEKRLNELRSARDAMARDLAATIADLTALADKAMEGDTTQALSVARAALAEAGRLKVKLAAAGLTGPDPAEQGMTPEGAVMAKELIMSHDEWMLRFTPPDGGGERGPAPVVGEDGLD